ncbi:hypothetical protein ACFVDH_33255 [Streptomyces sp. NPDC057674]
MHAFEGIAMWRNFVGRRCEEIGKAGEDWMASDRFGELKEPTSSPRT